MKVARFEKLKNEKCHFAIKLCKIPQKQALHFVKHKRAVTLKCVTLSNIFLNGLAYC